MRFALPVVAAFFVLGCGTACSGNKQAQAPGTSTAPATTTTSTRPQRLPNQSRWARQVDAACKPWQKQIDAITPAPTDVPSLQKWLARALPLVRKQIAAVKAVKPPANQDEATKVKLFLASLQKTERALTSYLVAIHQHAPARAQKALDEAGTTGSAARADAVSLDITQCGGYASG
jgi:hypothetical protein